MNSETARYIINYFSNLLTGEEQMGIKHTMSLQKLHYSIHVSNSQHTIKHTMSLQKLKNFPLECTRIFREKGWLSSDQNAFDLLNDGYENFELIVANRILNQHNDKVFLNNCPKCKKLARTPYARQCRHCGHTWYVI